MDKLIHKENVLSEDELAKVRKGELMPMPEVLLKDESALQAVLSYITQRIEGASKKEKHTIAEMVDRYLKEIEERDKINTHVANTFLQYASRARNVIPLSGGALSWLVTDTVSVPFVVYGALFALFGPLANSVIDRVGDAGHQDLERARGKLIASIRPR